MCDVVDSGEGVGYRHMGTFDVVDNDVIIQGSHQELL